MEPFLERRLRCDFNDFNDYAGIIQKVVLYGEMYMEKRTFSDYTAVDEIAEFFDRLGPIAALDTETTGLNYYQLRMLGISFCDGALACYIDMPDFDSPLWYEVIKIIDRYITEKNKGLVLHNANFDLKVLWKEGIELTDHKIFDTQVAAHLLNEEERTGLKFLANKYLGADPISYVKASQYGTVTKEFFEYGLNDAIYTWKLHKIFNRKLYSQGLNSLFYDIEMPFQYVLMHLHIHGVAFDENSLDKIETQLRSDRDKLVKKLYEIAGKQHYVQRDLFGGEEIISACNLNSPKQLIDIIEKDIGRELDDLTPGGQKSTGAPILKKLKNDSIFVKNLLVYRAIEKALNGFVSPVRAFLSGDGRLRPSYQNNVCVTGRLSCCNPNLQQLPRPDKEYPIEYRRCFIAPNGKSLISLDYSGQEMRVLAHISNDPTLLEVFRKNLDPHLMTAKILFDLDIPNECLSTTHAEYETYKNKYSKERYIGKNGINFPIVYGTTAYGIAKNLQMKEEDAQKMIDKFLEKYPGVAHSIKRCGWQVKSKRWVATEMGRRRRLNPKLAKSYRQAFNFLIQSLCADILRAAMVHVLRYVQARPEYDIKIVMTIHDEIVLECKDEYVELVASEVAQIMKDVANLNVPLEVDWSIGKNYLECK